MTTKRGLRTILLALVSVSVGANAATSSELTTATFGAAPYQHSRAAVASNGSSFLVAWETPTGAGTQIFATVADAAGRPLTQPATWVGSDAEQGSVQVIALSENYAVLWSDTSQRQRAVELTASGQRVRMLALPSRGKVASNGELFAIVSQTHGAARETVTFANRDGKVVATTTVEVSDFVSVIAAEQDFVVLTWGSGVVATRLRGSDATTVSTTVIQPLGPRNPLPSFNAAIAPLGARVAIAWSARYADNDLLHAEVIERDGSIARREDVPLSSGRNRVGAVWLSAHDEGFTLITVQVQSPYWNYSSAGDVIAYSFDRAGSLSSTTPTEIANTRVIATAARGPVPYMAGFAIVGAPNPDGSHVLGGPIGLNSGPWTPHILSIVRRRQSAPRMASDGVNFQVLFVDDALEDARIATAVVDPDRQTEVQPLSAPLNPRTTRHDIAFSGSIYLAVWTEGGKLLGRRLLPGGVPVDQTPIVIRDHGVTTYSEVAIAWNGSRFLVAWAEGGGIVAAFVAPDGLVSHVGKISIQDSTMFPPSRPRLAWNGRVFLLVWDGARFFTSQLICDPFWACGTPGATAIRLGIDAAPLDSAPLLLVNAGVANYGVAAGGDGFFVTLDTTDPQVYRTIGRYVSEQQNALVAGPPIVLFEWISIISSAVAFDGIDFIVGGRYGFDGVEWLATKRVFTLGQPRVMQVEASDSYPPAIAVGASREPLLLISELREGVGTPRLHVYRERDLPFMPSAPAAPVVRSASVDSRFNLRVSWTPVPSAVGYVIEVRYRGSTEFKVRSTARADESSMTTFSYSDEAVRVRAFNASGFSAPSNEVPVTNASRRRAVSVQ